MVREEFNGFKLHSALNLLSVELAKLPTQDVITTLAVQRFDFGIIALKMTVIINLLITGEVSFRDGQSNAEVIVYVRADDMSELAEKFQARLVDVDGGADLNRNSGRRQFMIR